jgi:SAM-dependent methyltransferase
MTSDPNEWAYGDYAPDPGSRDLIGLKASWILDRLPQQQTPAVLDFGSGEGKYLHLIRRARPGAKLIGVDVRRPKRTADFEFHLVPEGSPLPFANDQFDVVVSCDVMEHVSDPRYSLAEVHRVLRPGGRFIGFVPIEGGAGPHGLFRLFSPGIYRDTKDHQHAYTRAEMLNLLNERFAAESFAYSYHLLGGSLDALFFASFKFPVIGTRMERFWRGQENSFYRQDATGKKISVVGSLTRVANRVAFWESSALRHVPFAASGLHFCLEKN